MNKKTIRTEEMKDGSTRYYDDGYHTLGYSKPDKYGKIIFYDEHMIPTGDYAERTTSNEIRVYDSLSRLKRIMRTYGSQTTFYDEYDREIGRSTSYVDGIYDYEPTVRSGRRGFLGDSHIKRPYLSEVRNPAYWETHYWDGRVVRFKHLNLFQIAALAMFAIALFINGITPAVLLYVVIGVLIFFVVKVLESMDFESAENYHPLSVWPGFEMFTAIGLAAAAYLRPRLNSFLYQNYYNNRLSVLVLTLTIIPVVASAVYKIIDWKRIK